MFYPSTKSVALSDEYQLALFPMHGVSHLAFLRLELMSFRSISPCDCNLDEHHLSVMFHSDVF